MADTPNKVGGTQTQSNPLSDAKPAPGGVGTGTSPTPTQPRPSPQSPSPSSTPTPRTPAQPSSPTPTTERRTLNSPSSKAPGKVGRLDKQGRPTDARESRAQTPPIGGALPAGDTASVNPLDSRSGKPLEKGEMPSQGVAKT